MAHNKWFKFGRFAPPTPPAAARLNQALYAHTIKRIMYITNIEFPGSFLQMEDHQKSFEITSLINTMENAIYDMAISLFLFEKAQKNLFENISSRNRGQELEKERNIESRVEEKYKLQFCNITDYYNDYEHHRHEVNKLCRTEKINSGKVPDCYRSRLPNIHAHSFLSSSDSFMKSLQVICSEVENEQVNELYNELEDAFPSLRKVRNSAQHTEDRVRGYGKPQEVKKKKKMQLKPIDNNLIKSEGGAIVTESLNGNKLGYTIDDGSYQEFEISVHTLGYFLESFNKILNCFEWSGPKQIKPHI